MFLGKETGTMKKILSSALSGAVSEHVPHPHPHPRTHTLKNGEEFLAEGEGCHIPSLLYHRVNFRDVALESQTLLSELKLTEDRLFFMW
ncbi:hypothetical protein EK904_013918 [Melospiza melodia maxima]|nr:hypothetical protein EK904_013918 [Melospiza melodia maxima]